MRHFFPLLLTALVLFACGQEKKEEAINSSLAAVSTPTQLSEPTPAYLAEALDIQMADLQNVVFETGSNHHSTDTCAFYFECDCCAGKLTFNPDSTFYALDFCMADETMTTGTYSITDKILTLAYNGVCVSKEYNWARESDSTAVEFIMKDTLVSAFSTKYYAKLCNDKRMLVQIENDPKDEAEVAIATKEKKSVFMRHLKEEAFLARSEKLKKKLAAR